MANPHRGEVTLEAGDKIYTLVLSTNALCDLEDHFGGRSFVQIVSDLNSPETMQIKTVRAVVWACLQEHHSGTDIKAAGTIITAAGMQNALEAVGKAVKQAFPDAKEAAGGVRPRQAKVKA